MLILEATWTDLAPRSLKLQQLDTINIAQRITSSHIAHNELGDILLIHLPVDRTLINGYLLVLKRNFIFFPYANTEFVYFMTECDVIVILRFTKRFPHRMKFGIETAAKNMNRYRTILIRVELKGGLYN